jgi:hypothetical protein
VTGKKSTAIWGIFFDFLVQTIIISIWRFGRAVWFGNVLLMKLYDVIYIYLCLDFSHEFQMKWYNKNWCLVCVVVLILIKVFIFMLYVVVLIIRNVVIWFLG